jgi:DNA-binding response OmpR family regulator
MAHVCNEEALPKVLIVEDEWDWQDQFAEALRGQAEIIPAFTLDEGRQKFRANYDAIKLIVMDACVPGDWPTTPPLIREFREAGFKGPMVAASGDSYYRQMLIEAGCDLNSGGKPFVPKIVAAFLASSKSVTATPDNGSTRPTADNISAPENRLVP